jgi:YbbR domain-containing protein
MMKIPGFLRHDIGLKAAAFALAVFLWVNVAERREVEIIASLPLKYINMAPDLTFASEVPQEARARIRGRGRFLRWRLQDIYFAIDLSPAEQGIVTHVVSEGEAQIPPEKEVVVLEVIEPKAVRLELDELVTRKLPPRANLGGDLEDDKVMLGRPVTDPAEVVVAGPEGVVSALSAVPTETVDVNNLARKGSVQARIDLTGLPYATCDAEMVAVSARIEQRKELGIPSVPIEPISGRGVKAVFTPDSIDVVISGAVSQVDSLDPRDLSIVVDVTNLPVGQLVFKPAVRAGGLYFEVRTVGRPEIEDQVFEIKARLKSPYGFHLVSVVPDQIGFVQR